jgi:hypothetical protein
MANFTVAVMKAAGVAPATLLTDLTNGYQMLDYTIDGSLKAIAATDTVELWDFPALTGILIKAAAVTVVKPGTASGTVDIQMVATDVTGLTAWATDATAGTQLVKLASAANTVVNTTATVLRLQQNTAGLGAGVLRVRIWFEYYVAPPAGI